MASMLDMAVYAAAQGSRVAWYLGNRLVGRRLGRNAPPPPPRPAGAPRRPAPSLAELLTDLARLFARDADNVRRGLYPVPEDGDGTISRRIARARRVLADIGPAAARRAGVGRLDPASLPQAAGLPDYYLQDFHYQNGGYLTQDSARLYDPQVEMLFLGGANAMRRQALAPLVRHFADRDQRHARLVDIGCGTGRFLAQAKQALPALAMVGIDLSRAYLAEAGAHLAGRRKVTLAQGAGEALPFADRSLDAATSIFVFHELPAEIRRAVALDAARVLKAGGLFILVDSLQFGDRPGWDGLFDGFDRSFNEPYFRSYAEDDMEGVFAEAGLALTAWWPAFLAKVMVFAKIG